MVRKQSRKGGGAQPDWRACVSECECESGCGCCGCGCCGCCGWVGGNPRMNSSGLVPTPISLKCDISGCTLRDIAHL